VGFILDLLQASSVLEDAIRGGWSRHRNEKPGPKPAYPADEQKNIGLKYLFGPLFIQEKK
jgi:hypothetical protein